MWHGTWRSLCEMGTEYDTYRKQEEILSHFFLSSFQYFNTNSTFVCVNSKCDLTSTVNINSASTFYKKEPVTTVHLMSVIACTVWLLLDFMFLLNNTCEVVTDQIKFYFLLEDFSGHLCVKRNYAFIRRNRLVLGCPFILD